MSDKEQRRPVPPEIDYKFCVGTSLGALWTLKHTSITWNERIRAWAPRLWRDRRDLASTGYAEWLRNYVNGPLWESDDPYDDDDAPRLDVDDHLYKMLAVVAWLERPGVAMKKHVTDFCFVLSSGHLMRRGRNIFNSMRTEVIMKLNDKFIYDPKHRRENTLSVKEIVSHIQGQRWSLVSQDYVYDWNVALDENVHMADVRARLFPYLSDRTWALLGGPEKIIARRCLVWKAIIESAYVSSADNFLRFRYDDFASGELPEDGSAVHTIEKRLIEFMIQMRNSSNNTDVLFFMIPTMPTHYVLWVLHKFTGPRNDFNQLIDGFPDHCDILGNMSERPLVVFELWRSNRSCSVFFEGLFRQLMDDFHFRNVQRDASLKRAYCRFFLSLVHATPDPEPDDDDSEAAFDLLRGLHGLKYACMFITESYSSLSFMIADQKKIPFGKHHFLILRALLTSGEIKMVTRGLQGYDQIEVTRAFAKFVDFTAKYGHLSQTQAAALVFEKPDANVLTDRLLAATVSCHPH